MSTENTGSVQAAVEGDGIATVAVPGTDAVVEIDLQLLTDEQAFAAMNPNVIAKDLPDLVPHSGENFGKPQLTGGSK